MRTVLAIDIGGTKIAGGVVDEQGTILLSEKVSTHTSEGGLVILEQVASLLTSLQSRYLGTPPVAIGISTGGQIDATGQIIGGTDMIPNWVGLPLKETIAERFGLPTAVLNDGHAAALAEFYWGAGKGYASMLCVVIGTGLGGGLVIDGKLQHGTHGLAGSIGQMKVLVGEEYVALETLVSGPGLVQLYNGRHPATAVTTGYEVAQRNQQGDSIAHQAIIEMGRWLGLGLSHALHTYDAECVVVGGSVAQLGSLLLTAAQQSLKQHGHVTVADTVVKTAVLGPQAGLVGAVVNFL